MRIVLSTAEASGDRIAGQLVAALRQREPDCEIYGVGGAFLRAAGAEVILDASQWGVIGIAAALKLLPRMVTARNHFFSELRRRPPDVFVPIDAGALHLGFGPLEGMCPWLRRNLPATKICYYFPPGSWRKTLRYTDLGPYVDAIATPYPWNASELNRLGVAAQWVGHPLLDLVRPTQPARTFQEKCGLDPDKPVVGLLPGSRAQEIDAILATQLAAAVQIAQRVPGAQFLIALAPTIARSRIEAALRAAQANLAALVPHRRPQDSRLPRAAVPVEGSSGELARRQRQWIAAAEQRPERPIFPPFVIVEDATYDVMNASDALICTSGTATMEAAILGKPMVIVYKMSKSNQLQLWIAKRALPRFVGMPNLIAEKEICPELLGEAATPDAIASEIIGLLLEPERMLAMRQGLHDVVAQLGQPGGAERTAELILGLARQS